MTGFLARLVGRAAGGETGLEPRPRHRFADPPGFAGDLSSAADPLATGLDIEDVGEAGERDAAGRAAIAASPFETSFDIGDGRLSPDGAEAAGAPAPIAPHFARRPTATRSTATAPTVSLDPEPAAGTGRTRYDASDGVGRLMPLAPTAASGGSLRTEDAGFPTASGRDADGGVAEARLRFNPDAAARQRHFGAGALRSFAARGMPAPEEAPTIVVRIGRIDVRAVHAPAAAPPSTPKSRLQRPSLDAYLRGRERRGG